MDMPSQSQPHLDEPAVYAQANRPASEGRVALISHWEVPNDAGHEYQAGQFTMNLAALACSELLQVEKNKSLGWHSRSCSLLAILKTPSHGELIEEGNGAYGYRPQPGYLGNDTVEYAVRGADGRLARLVLTIRVLTFAEVMSRGSGGAAPSEQVGHRT